MAAIKCVNIPFFNKITTSFNLPFPNAFPIKGVSPKVIPIPKNIPIIKTLLANDEAANSVVPTCPTIILSTRETVTCPICDSTTGRARCKFRL